LSNNLKPVLVEKCWIAASFMTCKSGLDVGVGFFQLHLHSFIPYMCPLAADVYFENCITRPYHIYMTSAFFAQECFNYDRNRSEQLYPVQPLPSCATVSGIVLFKTLLRKC